jgi:hypothetical protein
MYGYSNQTEPTIQAVSHQYAPDLPRTRRHVESSQPLPALCQPTRQYGTHLHLPGRLAPSGRLASHRLVSCCRPLPGYVTRYRRAKHGLAAPSLPTSLVPSHPAVAGQALPGRPVKPACPAPSLGDQPVPASAGQAKPTGRSRANPSPDGPRRQAVVRQAASRPSDESSRVTTEPAKPVRQARPAPFLPGRADYLRGGKPRQP